jgi:peptide-methionine (S)-S-oxide reductase
MTDIGECMFALRTCSFVGSRILEEFTMSQFPRLYVVLLILGGFTMPFHAAERPPQPALNLTAPKDAAMRTAVFAGGCFWCTEAAFEPLRGVQKVVSGYAGDTEEKATYKSVCSGATNHAEAIRIEYDPARISYGQLLQVFFAAHDPTTLNRQGADRGRQYRSAIFSSTTKRRKSPERTSRS